MPHFDDLSFFCYNVANVTPPSVSMRVKMVLVK